MITLFSISFNQSISFSKCPCLNTTSLLITQIYSPFANSTPLFRAFVTPTLFSNLKYLIFCIVPTNCCTTSFVSSVDPSSMIKISCLIFEQTSYKFFRQFAVNLDLLYTGTTIESFMILFWKIKLILTDMRYQKRDQIIVKLCLSSLVQSYMLTIDFVFPHNIIKRNLILVCPIDTFFVSFIKYLFHFIVWLCDKHSCCRQSEMFRHSKSFVVFSLFNQFTFKSFVFFHACVCCELRFIKQTITLRVCKTNHICLICSLIDYIFDCCVWFQPSGSVHIYNEIIVTKTSWSEYFKRVRSVSLGVHSRVYVFFFTQCNIPLIQCVFFNLDFRIVCKTKPIAFNVLLFRLCFQNIISTENCCINSDFHFLFHASKYKYKIIFFSGLSINYYL